MNQRLRMIVIPVILAALAALLSGCGQPSGAQNEAVAPEVRVVKVAVEEARPRPIKDVLILPGATRPYKDVTLAADQGGLVEWIGPREGDRIKQGDLVAKVDVSSLKAALENARSSATLAEDLYQRRKKLYERQIVSREEFEQSRTQHNVAQGTLRQAQVAYDQGFVYSPMDGLVNSLAVDPGEFVARGGAIAEVVNVDQIKVVVNAPELDVRYLKKGQQAMVRVDAFPDRDMTGTIDYVSYKADSATRTFEVWVLVDNSSGDIRPGMIARVAFLRRIIPDALTTPLFSIVDKGGERLLFVVEDGVARSRRVELGVIDSDRIQVTEGLKAGDRIIVTGQTEVEEGTKVQVQ